MNEVVKNIEKQVKSCQNLLSIFQDERQMYQEKQAVGMTDVMKMLERKKQVMEVFEKQQCTLRQISEMSDSEAEQDKGRKKTLLRDLAATLEQLLVIDHENEKLLRESMGKRGPSSSNNSGSRPSDGRQRPALLSKRPFVPNSSTMKPLSVKPSLLARRDAPVANSRLRQYIQSSRLGGLEAKYA